MLLRITSIPGDGVGPEVVGAALRVLGAVTKRFKHRLQVTERVAGWAAVRRGHAPLPAVTLDSCLTADAVLLGALGDPAADALPPARRPEAGLLRLRKALGCYANLRPARLYDALIDRSPLRRDVVAGTDLLIVRELAGDIYYSKPRTTGVGGRKRVTDSATYTVAEIRRIARTAFDLARTRRRRVVSVDKANVMAISRLWREVVNDVALEYPDVDCSHMLVDRAAMELVLQPSQFDVIVTSNLFGDILSDEAGGIAGSLGLLASASLGGRTDLYEPVHGSAPDLAGQDRANPVGTILSVALMLRYTFKLETEAAAIERATEQVLAGGLRTQDLSGPNTECVGTQAFAVAVVDAVTAMSERAA